MTDDPAAAAVPVGLRTVGSGLRFCEGPVWLSDDRVLVTEIASGTLATVSLEDGTVERVVSGLAGPNGAASVPDGSGRLWVADNGGFFTWVEAGGRLFPSQGAPEHRGGALVLADPGAGTHRATCTRVADGSEPGSAASALVAPNDLVVDAEGGVWWTDFGVQDDTASAHRPGVVYLASTAALGEASVPTVGSGASGDAGGAVATPVVWGTHQANGIGLANDGGALFVAETHSASIWAFAVEGPGRVAGGGGGAERHTGRLLHRSEGVLFDSLAVDPDGWVCVATIGPGGGVTCVDPGSGETVRVGAPDDLTTNVAFRTVADGTVRAVLTLSSTGALAVIDDWVAARQAARG
jgi:gluconolactonase